MRSTASENSRVPRRLLLPVLAALALLAPAASAMAATQTKDDAVEGWRNDLVSATWDVTPTTTTLTFDVGPNDFADWLFFFVDTNKDGKSDFAIDAAVTDTAADHLRLVATPDSTPTCQVTRGVRGTSDEALAEFPRQEQTITADGNERYTLSFSTALIGGAQTFDWAAYATTWGMMSSAWDYMPDAANFDVDRPNPVEWGGQDTCDFNDDGKLSVEDTMLGANSESGFVPLRMAEGFTFPDEGDEPTPSTPGDTSTPGPPASGGTGGGAAGGGTPASPTVSNLRSTDRDGIKIPKVVGLRVDKARAKLLAALGYADFTVKEVNLAKPPKGIGFGDVVEQTPKAGATRDSSITELPQITLETYAGPKPKGAKSCLDGLAKDVKGMEMALAVDLLKKAGCKLAYNFKLGSGAAATVTKVTPRSGPSVVLDVTVPKDRRKHDLFLSFRESPNQLSFDAADWTLTASDRQRNFFTVQVLDRLGRFVNGANVQIDTTDVGGVDPSVAVTRGGETTTSIIAPRGGTVDVIVYAVGANDVAIYGAAQLTVADRSKLKAGASFTTTSGRTLVKAKDGNWSAARTVRTAGRAAAQTPLDRLIDAIKSLFGGWSQPVAQTVGRGDLSSGQKLTLIGDQNGMFPAVLAVGDRPLGKGTSPLIGTASGNVVAAGGGNLIGSAAGNVVAAGGMNLQTVAGAGVVAAGGGNLNGQKVQLIDTAKGNGVVSAGGGNVIDIDGQRLLSDNGLGLIGSAAGNVVAPGGGNLMSLNHAGVVSAGGAN